MFGKQAPPTKQTDLGIPLISKICKTNSTSSCSFTFTSTLFFFHVISCQKRKTSLKSQRFTYFSRIFKEKLKRMYYYDNLDNKYYILKFCHLSTQNDDAKALGNFVTKFLRNYQSNMQSWK